MKYYKHWAESQYGDEGSVYFEIDNEIVTRQVELYPDKSYWMTRDSEKDPDFEIADQTFPVMGLTEDDEISREEFEKIWEEAHSN